MRKLKAKAKQNSENIRPKFNMEQVFNFLENQEDFEKFNSLDELGQEQFLKEIGFFKELALQCTITI